MWVIKKGSLYLKAGTGHHKPWTNRLEYAAKFHTETEARREACGNERVVRVEF